MLWKKEYLIDYKPILFDEHRPQPDNLLQKSTEKTYF